MSTLASRLKTARTNAGLGLRALARQVGVNHSFLSGIENGTKSGLADDTAARIARELNVDVAWLATGAGEAAAAAPQPLAPPANDVRPMPHANILPSPLNPRKHFDPQELKDLADNIATNGLLQNLVARLHPKKAGKVEIAAGERRWRAIGLLIEARRWPADRPIPVQVRDLDDYQLLELGAGENIQRANMHPLEEGEAFAALVDAARKRGEDGATEKLAARFGKTERWVQLRMALARKLAPKVKEAFLSGKLNLEAARAFTVGSEKTQAAALTTLAWEIRNGTLTGERVRQTVTQNMIPVDRAHFPPELYKGEIADDGRGRYFVDAAEFLTLQETAIDLTIEKLAKTWAWVEREDGWDIRGFHAYGRSKDKAKAGAIVLVTPRREVKVTTGLLKPAQVKAAARAAQPASGPTSGGGEDEPAPAGEPWTQAHLAAAKQRKTAAMQSAVMRAGPGMAMKLVCLALLGGRRAVKIKAEAPEYNQAILSAPVRSELAEQPKGLGVEMHADPARIRDCPVSRAAGVDLDMYVSGAEECRLWAAIAPLTDAETRRLFTALVAARVGTFHPFRPGFADEAVAVEIARSLGVGHGGSADGAGPFEPDAEWFKGYRKPALVSAAILSGVYQPGDAGRLQGMTGKKIAEEIVASTLRDPNWIPAELHFAAGEGDAPEDAAENEDAEEGDGQEEAAR